MLSSDVRDYYRSLQGFHGQSRRRVGRREISRNALIAFYLGFKFWLLKTSKDG
jgi:hypothetical protein